MGKYSTNVEKVGNDFRIVFPDEMVKEYGLKEDDKLLIHFKPSEDKDVQICQITILLN